MAFECNRLIGPQCASADVDHCHVAEYEQMARRRLLRAQRHEKQERRKN